MARGYPDYEGNKSAMYSVAEWAAKEGTEHNLIGIGLNKAWGETVENTHLVPEGKTFYVTSVGMSICATAEADADNNQVCRLVLSYGVIILLELGGNGGCGITLSKPYSVAAGQTVSISGVNEANHNCNIYIFANGYEV